MDTSGFSSSLLSGERILWTGQPAPGVRLTGRDWFLIPFSLLWGGFAVFWEVGVTSARGAPGFMALFGVPFVLIGLFMIFGRFLADAWVRNGTQYALTNRRILISRSSPFGKFTAAKLAGLPTATLTESAGGRGTIRFGESAAFWGGRNSWGSWMPSLDPVVQFIEIEDAPLCSRKSNACRKPTAAVFESERGDAATHPDQSERGWNGSL